MSRAYSLKYPAEIKENMYFAIETFAGHPEARTDLPPGRERAGLRQGAGGLHADGTHGRGHEALNGTTTGSRFRLRISEPGPGARGACPKSAPKLHLAAEPKPEAIMRVARDADALLATYAKITAEMIRQMKRCRIISRFGIGVDNVDIPVATERRHRGHQGAGLLPRRSFRPRHGAVAGGGAQDPARELAGACRPLGDAGGGADSPLARKRSGIGRLRAHSATGGAQGQVFRHAGGELTTRIFRRRFSSARACEGVEFAELLKISDYISIHSPLLPETQGIVQRRCFPAR